VGLDSVAASFLSVFGSTVVSGLTTVPSVEFDVVFEAAGTDTLLVVDSPGAEYSEVFIGIVSDFVFDS
jgi:hypothetical protein